MSKPTNENYLDLPMVDNSGEAKTFREYFKKLLQTLMEEGEGFSGKRPFGDSSWEYDLYDSLIENKIIESIESFEDRKKADKIIMGMINDL